MCATFALEFKTELLMMTARQMKAALKKELQVMDKYYDGARLDDQSIETIINGFSDVDIEKYSDMFFSFRFLAQWITLLELHHPTGKPMPSVKEIDAYRSTIEKRIGYKPDLSMRDYIEMIRFYSVDEAVNLLKENR